MNTIIQLFCVATPDSTEEKFNGQCCLNSLYFLNSIYVLSMGGNVCIWTSLVAQMVKNPPAVWEIWVSSLGWEDPLEEGMATHSSTLAWRIPMDRGAWWAAVHGVAKSWTWLCIHCILLYYEYFGHLMWRVDSLEKILMLGKIEGRRRRGQQSMRWLDGFTDSVDMSLSKLQEIVKDREAWHGAVHEVTNSQTQLTNWKTTTYFIKPNY